MSDNKLFSHKINELIKNIECNNISAVDDFWTSIRKDGAPLVDKIDGDKENVLVTFIYKDKGTTENVLIYGTFPGYDFPKNEMEKLLDTDIWFKTYKVRNDIKFKYNFSINCGLDYSYKNRSENSILDELNPNKVVFMKDEEDPESEEEIYSLVELENFKPEIWTKDRNIEQKGKIDLHIANSSILKDPRRIWIYKPYEYSENNEPYNLLVLTDGFEYINWMSAQIVLDNLIESNKITPTVCVFIASNSDRYEELTCNDNFSNFISQELMDWIYENYNVTKEPQKKIIGGLSLGGLMAAYIAFKNSDVFGNVLSQSGSYWYEEQWLTQKYKEAEKLPINFYLNAGVLEDRPYDTEPIMMKVINNMRDVLLSKGYNVKYENFY
ncbi:hypothetical protein IAI10_04460 [Clostridium sp. 19966]|uniref:alpha/beta hydrolase n=1 Tax=Clostridium sp. 19966 TaxID=2768166 RepID=UPI0028DF622E|nr:alpha/beta hydrolase-fold protein [Clostridium sp. 19966]MDT8715898.1 hypothetical protein [Clostridium sp. 19966]